MKLLEFMKGLIGKPKKQKVAIIDPGSDKAMERDGSSMGSKEGMKSVNIMKVKVGRPGHMLVFFIRFGIHRWSVKDF